MEEYLATFHTHVSALLTARRLNGEGLTARMAPVPRALSSSCGTCVRYAAEHPHLDWMDADVEGVYRINSENGYEPLMRNL